LENATKVSITAFVKDALNSIVSFSPWEIRVCSYSGVIFERLKAKVKSLPVGSQG